MARAGVQKGLVAAGLAVATVAVYFGVWDHAFLSFDDGLYIVDNPFLREGLSATGLRWAATTGFGANWFPVTWLSLLLDYELHGLEPAGYLATNLVIHVLSSVLLFLVLARMTQAPGRSAFVAGVFALHPLHVESVAWASERKDVLSGLFWMLTLGAWARYAARPSATRYVAVFVALALGLMAKPMLVTLPFVLLLLDDWPLGRLRSPEGRIEPARLRRLAVEKLPLLALVVASSVITLIVQRAGGAMRTLDHVPLDERLGNALVAYVRYIGKAFFPSGLAVFYPHPESALPLWQPLAAAAFLVGVSVFAFLGWRRRPYLFMGWFWFVGTLVPVIGLVQVGNQAIADRYTYLPLIGLSIAVTWGAVEAAGRALPRPALRFAGALVLAVLGGTAWLQVRHWRDDITLFSHAIAVTSDNMVAHTTLGYALIEDGRADEAAAHLEEAIRIAPRYAEAHGLLGGARYAQGRLEEAVESYQRAVALDHEMPRTWIGLGTAQLGVGRVEEAAEAFRTAARQRPDLVPAHTNLGLALERLGRSEEAEASYRRALALDPGRDDARAQLALVLAARGESEAAVAELDVALRFAPESSTYHALRATLLLRLERTDEAIGGYRTALRLGARSPQLQGNLAFLLATHPDPARREPLEAVRLAETAAATSQRRDAHLLDALSLSYAAVGRADESTAVAREALHRAAADGDDELASRIRARLEGRRETEGRPETGRPKPPAPDGQRRKGPAPPHHSEMSAPTVEHRNPA
jgi:tetratricopeptide (TPR) repeat protein